MIRGFLISFGVLSENVDGLVKIPWTTLHETTTT